jgi:PAS domain S-box-containing protein
MPGFTPTSAQDRAEGREPASFPQILDRCLATAMIAVDHERRITAFTRLAGELTGLSEEQALSQPSTVLPAPLPELLDNTLRHNEPIEDRHILLPAAGGVQFTVRVSTAVMRRGDGSAGGAVAVLHDLSPARHLDDNLRRLDRLASIGTLSASMAHEIKNAMVAIKTFVDLLIRKNQDSALADVVGREMRRIDSIVSQMLRFAGPAKPTFAPVRLHLLLDESLNLVQHHLEGRRIKLLRDFRADPDTLRGDVYQLQQAFLNLFFNALEAMGSNGELKVATEFLPAGGQETPRGPLLRVTVCDTGVGIAPEHLERLFDPFFTTKPNGTGLGLPITRRIVQEHQGAITVDSELNRGTTFVLLLPSAARQP